MVTRAKPQLAVLIFFFAIYVLASGAHTYSNDEESMFFVTAAMARRGEFDVPPVSDAPVAAPMRGLNGMPYASYGILPSAVALPLYFVGSALTVVFPRFYGGYIVRFPITLFLNPIFTALTAMLLFQSAGLLGYRFRIALLTVLCYGFGTIAWVYAKTYFSEPLGTMLAVTAFVLLLRFHREPRLNFLFASGLVLGLAVTTKTTALVNLPVFILYLLYLSYQRRAEFNWRSLLLPLLVWGSGIAGMIAIVGAYNYVRFGDPLQTGYSGGLALFSNPLWVGLYGLVLSPGKSLFLFSPVLLLSIPAFWLFARRHAAEAAVCAGLTMVYLVVYGLYLFWHGDSSWGPRYMVFVMPFLVLPLAALLDWVAQPAHARWRAAVAALAVLSVLVELLGVLINFDIYPNQSVPEQRYYELQASPLFGHIHLLDSVLTNTQAIPPMPEGSIARFGWFFDPAQRHPFDLWYLYIVYSGMQPRKILALIVPIVMLCLLGLAWSGCALWQLWQRNMPAPEPVA